MTDMAETRPISAAALAALVDQVSKTGCAAEVKSKKVEIIIRPPERSEHVNPADLIDP